MAISLLMILIVLAIPFVIVLVAVGIPVFAKVLSSHRERMAMIQQGLHPDYPPDIYQDEQFLPEQADVLRETQPYVR